VDEKRIFDVITFGETMLRLSAPGYGRLEEAVTLDVRIGGSESNTAVALARLGLRSAWWSKLPTNPLGRRIENEIRRWGVDTSGVIWDESPPARAGLYFLDFGVAPRGIDVYYDRAASAASALVPEEINPERIAQARLLHLTGITPALSPSCAQATERALALARQARTAVSFDVNYRAKLWSPEGRPPRARTAHVAGGFAALSADRRGPAIRYGWERRGGRAGTTGALRRLGGRRDLRRRWRLRLRRSGRP